ncbi:MAG: extracellular solute-binding protein [Treponemataceae bacterium]
MKRSIVAFVVVLAVAGSVFAAGSKDGSSPAASAKDGNTEKPFAFTGFSPFYLQQPPKMENNSVIKKIEEYTNTKMRIDYVPYANYRDKLNVVIASAQLPMVTVVDGSILKTGNIVNAARSGMFWDVGAVLKNYPGIDGFYNNGILLANCSIDGKLYGLPRPRPVGRVGLVYRADWLKALNLKVPTTMQEFYETAKAFALNDPDKNGKNDTVGYQFADTDSASPSWNGIATLICSLGGINYWGIKDGKAVPDFMTAEYLDVLSLFRKMYQEKLLNMDFGLALGNKRYEMFNKGLAGMYFGTLSDVPNQHGDLYKVVPTAELAIAPAFTGPKGQRTNAANPGHNGMLMFSKTAVKTEADFKKIMDFYNKIVDPEMQKLMTYGIEGTHFAVENGKPKLINAKLLQDETADFSNILMLRPAVVETVADSPIKKAMNAAFRDNEKYIVPNIADALLSPTAAERGGEIDKIIVDARVKFIMGELDEAGFKKAVAEWVTRGGDKIMAEYTEQNQKYGVK